MATSRAKAFEYLPVDTVLTGLPVVSLGVTPQDLASRADVAWHRQDTEMGMSDLAILRLGTGGPRFALRSFDDSPFPTITVSADAQATSGQIDELLSALGIEGDEVLDRVSPRPLSDKVAQAAAAVQSAAAARAIAR